jgi:probable F420-dependent oxidoreductase
MPGRVSVGLGLMEFPFSGAAGYWRWVDLCEAGGADSIWQTDRIVSASPILECMSVMAALAGRTRRLKFGMNVVSLALRDPVLLAKQCATIDMLSEGRLLPAFGIGSPRSADWAALNIDTGSRGKKADEALDIIHLLWTQDKVDYVGQHYRLTNASIAPKPVQPDLPIWIGGSSDAAIRRTARIGTGWQAGAETPDQIAPLIASIKQAAKAAGRVIDEDHYGVSFLFRFGKPDDPGLIRAMEGYRTLTGRDPAAHFAVGDAEAIFQRIEAYRAAGAYKFILRPAAYGDADMLAQTRMLVETVLPEIAVRWPYVKADAVAG